VAVQIAEPISKRLAGSFEPASDQQILVAVPRPERARTFLPDERQRRSRERGAATGEKRAA